MIFCYSDKAKREVFFMTSVVCHNFGWCEDKSLCSRGSLERMKNVLRTYEKAFYKGLVDLSTMIVGTQGIRFLFSSLESGTMHRGRRIFCGFRFIEKEQVLTLEGGV